MKRGRKPDEILLTSPSLAWLLVFFLIPSLIVFAYAFKPHDIYGSIEEGWTFSTIASLANPHYYRMLARTLCLSAATTCICLALALPMGYYLAKTTKKVRQLLLVLIIVPFWTSFLIRIFAWKTLLHPEGFLKNALVWSGLIDPQTSLLYNSFAVLLVMVYTYLPFGVFPIYAAASKFNFQLCEAAMDLGATRLYVFFKVFIPSIKKAIATAMIMVFIPAVGAYVIPDLVGGSNNEMIGNKIAQKTFLERNLPEASALSILLAVCILVPMLILYLFSSKGRKLMELARSKE